MEINRFLADEMGNPDDENKLTSNQTENDNT